MVLKCFQDDDFINEFLRIPYVKFFTYLTNLEPPASSPWCERRKALVFQRAHSYHPRTAQAIAGMTVHIATKMATILNSCLLILFTSFIGVERGLSPHPLD